MSALSEFPLLSQSGSYFNHFFFFFCHDLNLARSGLGSWIASHPIWVSLTLILALFPPICRQSHGLWWRLVRLVWLVWLDGGVDSNWVILVPMSMNVLLSYKICPSVIKAWGVTTFWSVDIHSVRFKKNKEKCIIFSKKQPVTNQKVTNTVLDFWLLHNWDHFRNSQKHIKVCFFCSSSFIHLQLHGLTKPWTLNKSANKIHRSDGKCTGESNHQ